MNKEEKIAQFIWCDFTRRVENESVNKMQNIESLLPNHIMFDPREQSEGVSNPRYLDENCVCTSVC